MASGASIGSGALAGAAAGASAGSAVPGYGTVIGGVIGLIGGALVGYFSSEEDEAMADKANKFAAGQRAEQQAQIDAANEYTKEQDRKAWKWKKEDRDWQRKSQVMANIYGLIKSNKNLSDALTQSWEKRALLLKNKG